MRAIRRNSSLTGRDQDQRGSCVDNTSSGRENGRRAVFNGLVNTPVGVGGGSRRGGAFHFPRKHGDIRVRAQ